MTTGAVIILAAGNSSRLGKPKQLLPFGGKTLLGHIVDEAVDAGLLTIVISGANAALVCGAVKDKPITLIHNEDWQSGMASGIRMGVERARSLLPHLQYVITAVCDQPFVTASLFQELHKEQVKTNKGIVACAYANTLGTPVLFTKIHFQHLMNLQGQQGAKGLLETFRDDVALVPFPEGAVDIDTEEDYKLFLNHPRPPAGSSV